LYLERACANQWSNLPGTVVLLLLLSTLFTSTLYPAGDMVSLNGKAVRYWAFQLQGATAGSIDLIPLQNSTKVDLAVIDYSRDGSEQGEFSLDEIQALKDASKIVLAYMQIGSADAGRFYDQNPNDLSPFSAVEGEPIVGPENPSFPGTFFVKFWSSEWQSILFGDEPLPAWVSTSKPGRDNYLERILEAGFDGAYLDDIDGYQQFNLDGDGTRPTAALEMVLFIQQLSSWVKARKPDFLVFPQNGESVYRDALGNLDENQDLQLDASDPFISVINGVVFLDRDNDEAFGDGDIPLGSIDTNNDGALSQAEVASAYFNSIDGLGAEDFFFKGDGEEDNPFVDTLGSGDPRITDFKFTGDAYLDFAARDIPIFNVEYLTNENAFGLQQYCEVLSNQFSFTNLEITTDNGAPSLTNAELQSLTLIPFQAPSRDLNQLSTLDCGADTVLLANFVNGNDATLNSRVYLFNPSQSAGDVAVRVFTLPLSGGTAQQLTTTPLNLGSLGARSALNVKLAEDILTPLGITLPYTDDDGDLTLEFTIEAANVRGAAQVFSSSVAFGTYPLQEIPATSSGTPTVLVANFTNGNDAALNSRVYLFNPSTSAGNITVRVFTLPVSGGLAQELTVTPLNLGTLGTKSAVNFKLVEDILAPLGITTPYTTDGGNLTLEFTIQAAGVQGVAQVFSSSFAFGTYPLQ